VESKPLWPVFGAIKRTSAKEISNGKLADYCHGHERMTAKTWLSIVIAPKHEANQFFVPIYPCMGLTKSAIM